MFEEVCPIIIPNSSSCYHRIQLPLMNGGYDLEPLKTQPAKQSMLGKNFLFFNKTSVEPSTVVLAREKMGLKIILDIDDDWVIPVDHPDYKAWATHGIEQITLMLIDVADAVIVTNEKLAEKVSALCEHVYLIPNSIPFEGPGHEQFLPVEGKDGPVRFGWVGGVSHYLDLGLLKGVFRAYPNLPFTMAGYWNGDQKWDRMEKICSNNFHNPNYIRRTTMPLDIYMNHYNRIDVCLAPLENTLFNSYKSCLKIYEAGAKKCAAIVSDAAPYDICEAPVTKCKTSADWKAAVKKHMDRDYAVEKGEELYEWVALNRNMKVANAYREDFFKTLHYGPVTSH